jgi:hypothetical protein
VITRIGWRTGTVEKGRSAVKVPVIRNLQKIDAHGLSTEEVEAAFESVFSLQERRDSSFQMFAMAPSGRRIWVIWRYDREDDEIPDVFGDPGEAPILVITAY